MPKAAHEALKAEAKKKGLKGDAADRYVFGGLKKLEKGNAGRPAQSQHGYGKETNSTDSEKGEYDD